MTGDVVDKFIDNRLLSDMELGYWITTAIAGYAAALSTYSAVSKRQGDKRSAKVIVSEELYSFGLGEDFCFVVDACNIGKRPITVKYAELTWSNKSESLTFPTLACGTIPCKLSDGQSCKFQFPFDAYMQPAKA